MSQLSSNKVYAPCRNDAKCSNKEIVETAIKDLIDKDGLPPRADSLHVTKDICLNKPTFYLLLKFINTVILAAPLYHVFMPH